VDFSEARDLFENIFRISGQTTKIPDCRLISEKPEGLSAKSAKSRPRVDFPKVQGPLCKISEISEITNYFLTDNLWTGSTSPWTGRARSVHRGPTSVRTTGTAARSPKLGFRPLRCAKAHRRGRKTEREARGALLGPHRGSSGIEEGGRRRCRAGRRRRSVRQWLRRGEREVSAGRGAVSSGEGARLLYGPEEQRGAMAGAVNTGVNGINTIESVKGR
jgi:hypothetical protein